MRALAKAAHFPLSFPLVFFYYRKVPVQAQKDTSLTKIGQTGIDILTYKPILGTLGSDIFVPVLLSGKQQVPFPVDLVEGDESIWVGRNGRETGCRYVRMRSWMNCIFLFLYLLLCAGRISLPVCSAARNVNHLTLQLDNPLFLCKVLYPLPIWSLDFAAISQSGEVSRLHSDGFARPAGRVKERRSDQSLSVRGTVIRRGRGAGCFRIWRAGCVYGRRTEWRPVSFTASFLPAAACGGEKLVARNDCKQ